eukprot:4019915-Prymnesium_polylepis.3
MKSSAVSKLGGAPPPPLMSRADPLLPNVGHASSPCTFGSPRAAIAVQARTKVVENDSSAVPAAM